MRKLAVQFALRRSLDVKDCLLASILSSRRLRNLGKLPLGDCYRTLVGVRVVLGDALKTFQCAA